LGSRCRRGAGHCQGLEPALGRWLAGSPRPGDPRKPGEHRSRRRRPAGRVRRRRKDWTGRVNASDGTLWTGKYRKRRELETLRWERDQISTVLAEALPTWPISCRAVICLTSAKLASPVLEVGDITAVGPNDLVRHLAARPSLLQPAHIDIVADVLDRRLGPRTGVGPAVVRPGALPPLPMPVRPVPQRSPVRTPSRRPRARPIGRRPARRKMSNPARPIAAVAAALVLLLSGGAVFRALTSASTGLGQAFAKQLLPKTTLVLTASAPTPAALT